MKMLKTAILTAGLGLAALPAVAKDMTTVTMINPLPRSTNFFPRVVGEALG
jgi:hypothetical protein